MKQPIGMRGDARDFKSVICLLNDEYGLESIAK